MMTEEEIKRRVQHQKDKDNAFSKKLENLLEQGLLEAVAKLIKQVVGVVVDLSEMFWEWLKSLFL